MAEEVPSKMRAWRAHAYGAEGNPADTIAKMTLDEVDVPKPKEGQVLIRVEMAAINPIDWKLFSGGMDGICPVKFPYVPGFDVAGSIAKVGAGVDNLAVGDSVIADTGLVETCAKDASVPPGGGFAEYTLALASVVSKREGLAARDVVGLSLAGMTSWQALFTGNGRSLGDTELGQLESGQKLMVLGGAAATGCMAIQIAKGAGIKVFTTASDNKMPDGTSKIEFLKKMGAEVINYKEKDWSDELEGQDFDLVYDCVGDEADFDKASKILKKKAAFVSIANFSANSTPDVTFRNFLVKSNAEDLDKLVTLVREKKLEVPVDDVMPFDKVQEALTKSLGWSSAGKICIRVTAA